MFFVKQKTLLISWKDARMDRQEKLASIRRWSLLMRHACLVLAAALLAANAVHWLVLSPEALRLELGLRAVDMAAWRRACGLALVLAPVALLAFGLIRLRAAFASFARGRMFSAAATAGLRDFAGLAALSAVAAIVVTPALSFVLTAGLPRGPQIALQIGSGQLTILLVSGVTWVFANILASARDLADENAALHVERDALAGENAQFV